VDVGRHHVADGLVHQPVAGDGRQAAEGCGHDADPIVRLTAGGAGVSRMPMAFVLDLEFERLEAALQQAAQPALAIAGAQGITGR